MKARHAWLALGICTTLAPLWWGFGIYRQIRNYAENAGRLHRLYGFDHRSDHVIVDGRPREVFSLTRLGENMPFAQAGVRPGDIVRSHQILAFYAGLEKSRGAGFRFTVVDGGDGPSLRKRAAREIEVRLPQVRQAPRRHVF